MRDGSLEAPSTAMERGFTTPTGSAPAATATVRWLWDHFQAPVAASITARAVPTTCTDIR